MRHFLIWMMLAAAAGPAAGAPPQELELARQSCEQGKFLEAIRMFDRILNARAGTDAAAEADEALDRCVREVARSSEDDLLREISREYAGRAAGRKALSALALHALRLLEKCSPPPPLYEELLAHYGRTREAARVVIARANSCLGARKHEGEALRDLEKVGEDRKSTRLNSSHSQISYAVFCLKKKR